MKNKRKRIISFLMALAMILSTFNFNLVNPNTVYAQEESNGQATVTVNDAIKAVIDCMNKDYYNSKSGTLDGEAYAAMHKAGADIKEKGWKENKDTSTTGLKYLGSKVTQGLALMDLDEDPTTYKGVNLISDVAEEISKVSSPKGMGINEVKAVILLDRYNEKFSDKKVNYNTENAIKNLIGNQKEDGSINNVPQNTAAAIVVLNKHKDIEGVNDCITKTLDYLHKNQRDDGGILNSKSFNTKINAESVAYLVAAGENLTSDEWTKNGKTSIDALFTLWNGKGFVNSYGTKDCYPIPKVLDALASLKEAGYGHYQIKDVKFDNITKEEPEKTCKANITIVYPSGDKKYDVKFKPSEVTISNKKQSGLTILGALQAATDEYEAKGSMVISIFGMKNEGMNGWMYSLNGQVPDTLANETEVKDGDKIVWYYSKDAMNSNGPTYEEIVNIINGSGNEEKPVDATIDPKQVEVLPGESFTLNVKCEKGNYLVYTSEIPGVDSGNKGIEQGIKFSVPEGTKPGTYKLTNLAVYNIDESKLENYPIQIKTGLLEKMLKDDSNKVATLSEVTVVVKTNGKPEEPQKPEEKPEVPEKQKDGSNITSIISGVVDYYNKDHFTKNQGQLVNYEYSAMYKAGADLKKKPWYLVEKYETKYDSTLKYLGGKVNQSLILIDLDKDANNYDGRNLINEIVEIVDKNNDYFAQTDIQAVIAIDNYNEKFKDKKVSYNIEHAVEKILAAQCEDGGFKQRSTSVPINTGYALIALSKHKDIKGVNEAISKALTYLHGVQKDDGGLYDKTFVTGYHTEALRGIMAVGENPISKEWTKPSGKNPVDALFTLWKDNNSFDGKKGESINNNGWVEATWKALYVLVDLRDAGYDKYVVDGVKVKGINDGNDEKEEKTCKINVCIAMPENGEYVGFFKPQEVTISDKKHNKGFTALGALQASTTLFEMIGDMVTSIYGHENKGLNGWMYSVNGVVPTEMAGKVSVKAGDKIIWYYSIGGMEGKKPTWEELTGQKPEEKPEEKPEDATIDPKQVEVLPKESFTLNVKCNKGNYFVYTSQIPGVDSGNRKIESGIKIDVLEGTKPGTYKLTNLAVYNIDESSLEKFEGDIREGLLKKMLSEESNKVATLPDVTVVVKEAEGKEEIPSKDYTKEVEDSLNSTSSIILKANISDWNAFALKAAGVDIPDTYLKVIEEKIKNRDKSLFKEGKFKETTDCERTIIGVVAAGGDPRNIGNYNLVEDLCSRDLLNENNIYALAYGIIALDSGKFSLTKNCKFTREDIVNEIVNMQTNGGWGFGTVDSDTTSICLIALSNYKNDEKKKKAINDAVKVLNNIRNDKGEYVSSWNKNGSSESISQAIIALTALEIDPTSKEFTKGEKNLMDCLLDYKTKDGGFAHIKDNLDTANPVSTQQGLQALAAYRNFKSGKIGSIYNIKEFKDEPKVEEIEIKNLTDVKEFKPGTDAKITVQAINNTRETKNAALIVGLFDKNDRLVNYAAAEQSLDEGKSVNLRVNLKLPKESGYTVKAFVWNGLDDMTPLSNSIEIPVK